MTSMAENETLCIGIKTITKNFVASNYEIDISTLCILFISECNKILYEQI